MSSRINYHRYTQWNWLLLRKIIFWVKKLKNFDNFGLEKLTKHQLLKKLKSNWKIKNCPRYYTSVWKRVKLSNGWRDRPPLCRRWPRRWRRPRRRCSRRWSFRSAANSAYQSINQSLNTLINWKLINNYYHLIPINFCMSLIVVILC